MLSRKLLTSFIYASTGLMLMSADLHLQTSADPYTQNLELKLPDESLQVNLSAPGVSFTKDNKGRLTKLSFLRVSTLYHIWFHPYEYASATEYPKLIKRFESVEGVWMLKGKTHELDVNGEVISETGWDNGRLHGPQVVKDPISLQVLQEREYDKSFPIGVWKQYYHDGNLATEVTFPATRKAWLNTLTPGTVKPEGLHEIALYSPLKATETWYSSSGIKQAEHEYRLYYDGKDPVVEYTGKSRYFDIYGNIVTDRDTPRGSGTVSIWNRTSGLIHQESQQWINGMHFKSSFIDLPAQVK